MESAWIAGIFGVLGSLMGGFATFFSSAILQNKRQKSEGKVLKQSLEAEIKSILYLLRAHDYEAGLQLAIQTTEKGDWMAMVWPVRRDYCRIFNGNVSRIGVLKMGASETVGFYNLVQSLIEDLEVLGEDLEQIFRESRHLSIDWTVYSERYRRVLAKFYAVSEGGEIALMRLSGAP